MGRAERRQSYTIPTSTPESFGVYMCVCVCVWVSLSLSLSLCLRLLSPPPHRKFAQRQRSPLRPRFSVAAVGGPPTVSALSRARARRHGEPRLPLVKGSRRRLRPGGRAGEQKDHQFELRRCLERHAPPGEVGMGVVWGESFGEGTAALPLGGAGLGGYFGYVLGKFAGSVSGLFYVMAFAKGFSIVLDARARTQWH
jgi:hypothetical protein